MTLKGIINLGIYLLKTYFLDSLEIEIDNNIYYFLTIVTYCLSSLSKSPDLNPIAIILIKVFKNIFCFLIVFKAVSD